MTVGEFAKVFDKTTGFIAVIEPTRTPYEQSKSAVNRRFCYNMENDSMKLIVKAHE